MVIVDMVTVSTGSLHGDPLGIVCRHGNEAVLWLPLHSAVEQDHFYGREKWLWKNWHALEGREGERRKVRASVCVGQLSALSLGPMSSDPWRQDAAESREQGGVWEWAVLQRPR